MADPTAVDPDLDFLRSISPVHQPDASGTGPSQLVGAPSSWLPSGDLDVGREVGMGATQFGIGLLGLPSAVGRGAMYVGHKLAPGLVGEAPPWMSAEGPGGYGNALTEYSGWVPSNEAERVYAQGMRGAGSGAIFGPGGAIISGVGSAAGQGISDLGYPGIGRGVELASGLASGYRGVTGLWDRLAGGAAPEAAAAGAAAPAEAAGAAPRLGDDLLNDAGETNVIPFPQPRGGAAPAAAPRAAAAPEPGAAPAAEPALTPRQAAAEARAEREAANVERIAGITEGERLQRTWHPLTRFLGPAEALTNAYFYRRGINTVAAAAAPVVSAATSAARRILGLGVGGVAGAGQATQQIPPAGMSFSYVPPGSQSQTQLAPQPFLPQPLQLAPQPPQQNALGGWLR